LTNKRKAQRREKPVGYGKELNKLSKTSRPKMSLNNSQEIKITADILKEAIIFGLFPLVKDVEDIEVLDPIGSDRSSFIRVKIYKEGR
jgi:hypothetical protein